MKKVVFVLALAAAMSAVSCVKEQNNVPESSPRVISLTVKATPDTKVALSGWQPVWTGNEKMQVIFGNEGTSDAATTGRVYLDQTSTGIFAGEIEIPTGFNIDDIQGVVVGPDSWYRHINNDQKRIVMPAAADQTQSASGVFEGDNFPFYAEFDSSMLDDDGMGNYTISGLVLSKGFAVIRYNVYGAHDGMLASGEFLQSVGLTATGANIVGTTEYNKAGTSAGKPTFNGAGSNSTVSLGTAFPLKGTTVDDGAVIYQAVLARADGTNSSKDASVTKISVVTDKATYTKTLSLTLSPVTGHVYQFNVDLSKDFNREANVEYSIDGGATWTADIPASFSTLKLRGAMALDEPTLQVVADAVKAQSGNVDVDMSAMKVALTTVDETEVAQFPAVFGNATAADAAANLHSIIFPSNTTAIAAGAFYNCSALESIDLTKISSIGDNAFRSTGLKDLVVPETVTTLGNYVFGYCWKLETLYFDSPAHANATVNTHTFSLRNTSAVEELPASYKKENLIPLIATFGPHAVIGNQEFDTNHKLVKMIFEGKPTIKGNAWVIRCRYIETFDFSKVSSPVAPGANNLGAVGELVTGAGAKKIIVPKGCAATYYAASTWKQLVDVNGYVIEEQSNVEYSTDGGATWGSAIPDGAFTTLAVKGNITAATLDEIKTALDAKSEAVAIDLSQTEYESDTFPDTFAGTKATPYDKLKSINFPSNVITMVASAFSYCSALETVDLTGIEYLTEAANGTMYAFANSGLKTITFPSTFKGPMERSFVSTYELESIYWNTPWNPGTSQNWRTFQWGRGNSSATDNTPKSRDLVLTIGPGAVGLPMNGFRNNHNLTRVVVEASSGFKFYNNCFANCDNLAVFELKGALPPVINNANVYTDMSKSVTAANRKIIIPKGATAAYEAHANWAAWETMATALGFTVEEAAE